MFTIQHQNIPNMKQLLLFVLCTVCWSLSAQPWVDTTYQIQSDLDMTYGTATTFAGYEDTLKLDVSYPLDDVPPACGRPLMVIVHGGGWFEGDKNEGYPRRLRQDFAKRGYVTVSVNYRLGQFHTNRDINCNVPGWNCFNMTDSSEFYRANYRGVQDVNGAIRYLVNDAERYQIDPDHVFVGGESAGGFVAMGVGFLDDESEVLSDLVGAYPDAPRPNARYENACIRTYDLAESIDSMDLSRPALGQYSGNLNLPLERDYRIRAVGNIYGGAFNNIFETHDGPAPGLYMYHQPCDLVVPIGHTRLLNGFVNCLSQFPTFCGNIINRPLTYGSLGVKRLIDTMEVYGTPTAEYFYDQSTNNFNCLQQADPNFGCHAIDNYWLRTTNMAAYFADQMGDCVPDGVANVSGTGRLVTSVFPNPTGDELNLILSREIGSMKVEIVDMLGRPKANFKFKQQSQVNINTAGLPAGAYVGIVTGEFGNEVFSFIKR
jgi:acetyl esterase/lipase